MTRRQVPDVLLERFLADDLGAELRRTIEAERDADAEVRARLDELAAERRAFLEADPPAAFARRLAGQLEMRAAAAVAVAAAPARPRRWLAWVLGPSAAAAAAAAVLVTFTVTRAPDQSTAVVMAPGAVAPATTAVPAEATPGEPAADEPVTLDNSALRGSAPAKRPKHKEERVGTKAKSAKATPPPPPPKPAPVTTPSPEPEALLEAGSPAPAEDASEAPADAAQVLGGGGAGRSDGAKRSGLSGHQMAKVIRDNIRDIQACMKPSKGVPAGDYDIVIAWTVTATGSVENARIDKPKSLRGTKLARCLVREMRTWKFPATGHAVETSLPLKAKVE